MNSVGLCFNAANATGAELAVSFSLDAAGAVVTAQAKETKHGAERSVECALTRLRSWKFRAGRRSP